LRYGNKYKDADRITTITLINDVLKIRVRMNLRSHIAYQAKVLEKKSNKAKAIEHYDKFLSLWKDADPGIAEVADAKESLAGLKSQ
jgi:hypothetical protein